METIKKHKEKIKDQFTKLKSDPDVLKAFLDEVEDYVVMLKKKNQHEELAVSVLQEVKSKVYEDGEKRFYPEQFDILFSFVEYQRHLRKVTTPDDYIVLNYD